MSIFDIFKKEQVQEQVQEIPKGEIGVSFSTIYSTSDFSRYNPDSLQLYKGIRVYDKMLSDDQVKAVLQFKQHAIISRNWYFDAEETTDGEVDSKQQEIADFLSFTVDNMRGNFFDNLLEILSGIKYGFSIVEKIFMPVQWNKKPYWGLKDMKLRPFDTFNNGFITDKHGNLNKLIQTIGSDEIEIPLKKVIHFVHQPDVDRHYGESDLKAAYRAWWSKDIAIKFWNIHLERHAGGFAHAKIDPTKGTLSDAQMTNLKNFIENLTAWSGLLTPAAVDVDMIMPATTDAYEKAVAAHDKGIAKSLLVPNLLGLSEQGNTGSYAQSQTQLDAFFWVLDAIAGRVEEVLNEQCFRDLVQWNFGTEEYPPFKFEPISDSEKERISKLWVEMLKGNAVTKSDSDERWVRNLIGAPEKIEEEEPDEDSIEPVDVPDQEEIDDLLTDDPQLKKEFAEKPWLRRVNFTKIEKTMDTNEAKMLDSILPITGKIRSNITLQITKIGGDRSWGNVKVQEIGDIKIPKNLLNILRKAIRLQLNSAVDDSYEIARRELPKKLYRRVGPGMDKTQIEKFLSNRAMRITNVIEQAVLDAVQYILESGIKYDKTLKDIMSAMTEDTELLKVLPLIDSAGRAINIPARLENIARTNISDAVNQARLSLFGDPDLKGFVQAYEYSAVLDSRTTDICEQLNGKILKDFGNYVPPNHYQCRSLLVPVTEVDDWDGKESSKPTLEPQKGFG